MRTRPAQIARFVAAAVAMTAGIASSASDARLGSPTAAKWHSIQAGRLDEDYSSEGPFSRAEITVGGSEIRLIVSEQPTGVSRDEILAWVGTAAKAISGYYGKFPVPNLTLMVMGGGRSAVSDGVAFNGRFIQIRLGATTTVKALSDDWVLTHEMVHLAFPDLDSTHIWMEEGLATYLEPVARARIGEVAAENFWCDLVQGLPRGLPSETDRGLDRTHTWGRTYWGGAYFWLKADLEIRKRTQNRRSIDNALKAILSDGGTGARHWRIADVIETADRATGVPVFQDLYEQMGARTYAPDLRTLWTELGISRRGRTVTFDDKAPLAEIRRSITAMKP